MFKVGDKIKVINKPFLRSSGKEGIITSIMNVGGRNGGDFAEIATDTEIISVYLEFLELIGSNKWNPLNYKSHFKPVKLP